jgi:hypothetical protein
MLIDGVGEETALIVADIARRRADQAAHRVPLHIFDMSKRWSGMPMIEASWRATSVLPTPVGPEKR